jgi:prepilin-type N-terminal cleavage/methylation domain-containing protein
MTRRRGFTLVELLVVIAIIGTLVALLLPAVNAAREQGRLATCKTNLHNLQLACEHHADKQQAYPGGGWGSRWVGIADLGYGANQPGGWIYQILPYLDQGALHDIDKGLSATASAGSAAAASAKRVTTVIGGLYCPTRRAAKGYPPGNPASNGVDPSKPMLTGAFTVAGRTDYAANGGSVYYANSQDDPGPRDATASAVSSYPWPNLTLFNGIVGARSEVKPANITDNKDTTYLCGEKYITPDNYITGNDPGDLFGAMSGDDLSLVRWTIGPPAQDRLGFSSPQAFGSAHSAGWQVAFVGGNAQLIGWGIDPTTHTQLSTRNGHEVVDPTKIPH